MDFELETAAFSRDLHRLLQATRKGAAEAIRQQSRLFVADACALTPPTGGNPLGNAGGRRNVTSLPGNSKTAQRQGHAAIAREIGNRFVALESLDVYRADSRFGRAFRTLAKRGDFTGLKALLDNADMNFAEVVPRATVEILNRYRNPRTGKVRRGPRILVRDGRSIGRLIRQQQALVGRAKAGWVTPARALGLKLPAWITKHSEPGFISGQGAGDKLSIIVANELGYAQKLDGQAKIMARAWRNRSRNLRAQVEATLAAAARAGARRSR